MANTMITERQAVLMIENELPQIESRRLEKKNLYEFMQAYANRTCHLGELSELKAFETNMLVANRLYTEGNEEVREVMELVYISTLSHSLERRQELLSLARQYLSASFLKITYRDQLASTP